jgi:hypothetical protein
MWSEARTRMRDAARGKSGGISNTLIYSSSEGVYRLVWQYVALCRLGASLTGVEKDFTDLAFWTR